MMIFPIITGSGTSLSASSSLTFTYSSEVNLQKKWFDNKRLALKVDIVATSGSSGVVDLNFAIAEKSGSTFTSVVTASGTSLILTGGTTIGGQNRDGSYYIPLSIVLNSGITEWLTAGVVPFIKIGSRASKVTSTLYVTLLCG